MIRTFIFALLLVMIGAVGIQVYQGAGGELPIGDVDPSADDLCNVNLEGGNWTATQAVATNSSTRLTCTSGNTTRNLTVSYQNLTIGQSNSNS